MYPVKEIGVGIEWRIERSDDWNWWTDIFWVDKLIREKEVTWGREGTMTFNFLLSEINDQWSPKMGKRWVLRANWQEAMHAWKDGQFKPKGNDGGMYCEKGNRRSLRMMTGNFRLWLMIGEVRLAGWVFDCQENKKEDDPELFNKEQTQSWSRWLLW